MALPKPPINSMTDFVVFCFVTVVSLTLLASVAALIVWIIVDPGGDRSALTNSLTDILTTIIGALIGFIAGKGQGRSEVHEEQAEQRRQEVEP